MFPLVWTKWTNLQLGEKNLDFIIIFKSLYFYRIPDAEVPFQKQYVSAVAVYPKLSILEDTEEHDLEFRRSLTINSAVLSVSVCLSFQLMGWSLKMMHSVDSLHSIIPPKSQRNPTEHGRISHRVLEESFEYDYFSAAHRGHWHEKWQRKWEGWHPLRIKNHIPISNRIIWSTLEPSEAPELMVIHWCWVRSTAIRDARKPIRVKGDYCC